MVSNDKATTSYIALERAYEGKKTWELAQQPISNMIAVGTKWTKKIAYKVHIGIIQLLYLLDINFIMKI